MSARGTLVLLTALVTVAGASCTGDDDDGGEPSATAPETTTVDALEPSPTAPDTEVDDDGIDTTAAATTAAPETEPTDASTTTLGTVPDAGVPGIDSRDLFCRSWSQFAGSFQALALAAGFGADDIASTRLEVVASPVLIAAVSGLDAQLPAELESERTALVSDLVGPMVRRAEQARAELAAAGLSAEAIDSLGDSWLAALAEGGLDDPDLVVVVDEDVDEAALAAAVASFAAARPPINEDPSLITDARIPLTEQYLLENCPDQGTLGGNDVIDG